MTHRYNYMPNVPAIGATALVWAWWRHCDVRATWDGRTWRTTEGQMLRDVTHWHEQ